MKFIGIIPARYASTRFPGKPLAILGDKPVIRHVYEQASKALDTVVVATDDPRIYDCVLAFGGKAVMTRTDHRCGTDRCLEAYEKLMVQGSGLMVEGCSNDNDNDNDNVDANDDVIINIQGDEPFVQPEQIEAIKACFPTDIATLVIPFSPADGISVLENPNSPKVVVRDWQADANGRMTGKAVLFSRSVIPYMRGIDKNDWLAEADKRGTPYYKHLGMYAYRAEVLRKITTLPQSPLELTESLEQLRWLENGYEIKVGITRTQTIGIDTPEDLERAKEFLSNL